MAGSRTLKLSILADVDDLKKKLNQGQNDVQGFGSKLDGWASKAGVAFAAAGAAAAAYAGKLAIDGVKAAIEDQAAQVKLATTLENVTGATTDQIAATEKAITAMQFQYGVSDKDLRPSLDRLVRSTKDVAEAQKLQELALNISAGTGKDLQTVSEALAKAHDGNFTALKKLGGGIDESIIKSKDFDAATKALASTFEGQANKQADTFEGKMRRLSEATGEAKETIGGFILDAITPLVDGFLNKVLPAIQGVTTNISGELSPILQTVSEFVKKFFTPILEGLKSAFRSVTDAISKNKDNLQAYADFAMEVYKFIAKYLAPILGTTLKIAFEVLGKIIAGVIDYFSTLIGLVRGAYNVIKDLIKLIADNPVVQGISGAISSIFGGGKAAGGAVSAGTTYLVGEQGAELFTPSTSGTIIPNGSLGGGSVININVSGAIDPISTARQIADILSSAATSAGSFNSLGISRLVAV